MKHLLLIIVSVLLSGCVIPQGYRSQYQYNEPTYNYSIPAPTSYGGYQSGNNGGYKHCGSFINGVKQCW